MSERPDNERKDSLPNNIDPAHQQVNPSVVEDHLFKSNSHLYGKGQASGGTSSWDAIQDPKPKDIEDVEPTRSHDSSEEHRAYHGVIPATASINNILGNEANNLASNAPELGKQRRDDPRDGASRADHHNPSTREKLVGKVKVLIAKATGNQDVYSSGEALEDGHMEKGIK